MYACMNEWIQLIALLNSRAIISINWNENWVYIEKLYLLDLDSDPVWTLLAISL